MKLTSMVLALATICAMSSPQLVKADVTSAPSAVSGLGHVFGGPEVPFPLNTQVDFPWATIEGVWQAKGKIFSSEFSFHIQSNGTNGARILQVVQVGTDGTTVMSTGVGYSNGDDPRTVRAIMLKGDNSPSYWLIVQAYRNDLTGKIETVLTVRTFGGSDDEETHIVVRKLSSTPIHAISDVSTCLN